MPARKKAKASAPVAEPVGAKRVSAFKDSVDDVRDNLAPNQETVDCASCGTPNVPTLVQSRTDLGAVESPHEGKRIIVCGCNGKTVVVKK